ncbi:unknown [Ruminococcus sp. CAG:382]|nr:unknown [Ruminococcus sp. CAG:382]
MFHDDKLNRRAESRFERHDIFTVRRKQRSDGAVYINASVFGSDPAVTRGVHDRFDRARIALKQPVKADKSLSLLFKRSGIHLLRRYFFVNAGFSDVLFSDFFLGIAYAVPDPVAFRDSFFELFACLLRLLCQLFDAATARFDTSVVGISG